MKRMYMEIDENFFPAAAQFCQNTTNFVQSKYSLKVEEFKCIFKDDIWLFNMNKI